MKLTHEQLNSYEENGYVLVNDILPLEELSRLNSIMESLYQKRLQDPNLAHDEQQRNQIHRLGTDSEYSKSLARHPNILSTVEDIVKPGIALFSAKLISKGPFEPNNVCHWHQDEAYWNIYSESMTRMSVWLPLQDTDRTNGCLRIVPGTHKRKILPHEPRSSRDHGACRLSFLPGEKELKGTVYCETKKGSAILFSSRIFHSSLGNNSKQHRRAFILSYQEATVAGKDSDYTVLRPAIPVPQG